MMTFLMFGKYTQESMKMISMERTKKISEMVSKCGGEMKDIYAMLGEHDLMLITEFPSAKEAVKASVMVGKTTGICMTTCPAFMAQEFDKIMES